MNNFFCCSDTRQELKEHLSMHLSSKFYPPLPNHVKEIFLTSYNKYWKNEIGFEELKQALSSVYQGSLYDFGLGIYLLEKGGDI